MDAITLPDSIQKKLLFTLFLSLLMVWAFFILAPQIMPDSKVRWIFDPADLRVYFNRGSWILDKGVPISEYPQIPTYLFGLNRLLSAAFDPKIQPAIFVSVMSLEMVLVLFFTIKMLFDLLPGGKKKLAFLMLLPSTVWFVLNRFDLLPAFMCLCAFSQLRKNKYTSASIWLAVATFTKWYPVLFFPGFLFYIYKHEGRIPWKSLTAFAATSLLILASTFIMGGIDAILVPYQFHLQRGMEYFSFPVIVSSVFVGFLGQSFNLQKLFPLFFGLQVVTPFLSPFIKFDRFESIIEYSILAISCFILFSRIDSPQWLVWLMPVLIMAIRSWKDTLLIIAYNLVTFLAFPIAFDGFGDASFEFMLFNILIYVVLVITIIRTLTRLRFLQPGKPTSSPEISTI